MLTNHKREFVSQWAGGESLCPDCRGELIARRGDVMPWHWAHKPNTTNRNVCGWSETNWHLTWKEAVKNYGQEKGWQVEVPIQINGKKYRLDAAKVVDGKVVEAYEFVHSLSESYTAKHTMLRLYGIPVLWVFDGEEFASARAEYKPSKHGRGHKNLLKPKAQDLFTFLSADGHKGSTALVHWEPKSGGMFWFQYEKNPDIYYARNNCFLLQDAWTAHQEAKL